MPSTTRYRYDDRSYIDRRVDAIDAEQLEGPVRSVFRDPAARVAEWRSEPISYDFLNPSSGGIYRFAGTAEGGAEWRLVLKVTRSAESLEHGALPPPGLAEAVRWDRELCAYETGFLDRLPGGLVAPGYHGGVRHDDDTCWLWLDDLGGADEGRWSLDQWAHVARVLGRFNGSYVAAFPDDEWLGRNWLRVWVIQITPFSFGRWLPDSALWEDERIADAFPRQRLARLWEDREALLQAVEALPRTCSHLDSHRRNLFLRGEEVVAIDWGLVGLAAPGEEIASTLVGTVASGEHPADEAAALAATLYDGYVGGLREAGWRGRDCDVRLAFAAACGLRAFSILALDDPASLARAAPLARVLVDLGDEARGLAAL